MDHLLFLIFDENFLVKNFLCVFTHGEIINTAKFSAKNVKI